MPELNLKALGSILGETGGNPLESVGLAWGVPTCLINYSKELLQLLPTDVLQSTANDLGNAKKTANTFTADLLRGFGYAEGVFGFDTETGRITLSSAWYKNLFSGQAAQDTTKKLGSYLDYLDYGLEFGGQLFTNYTTAASQIEAIKECFDNYERIRQASDGAQSAVGATNESFNKIANQVDENNKFVKEVDKTIATINSVISERQLDPSKEPTIPDTPTNRSFFEGVNVKFAPLEDPELERDDTFRLVYGPPITSTGQFVLTSDGLYYDGRSGGLDPIYASISGSVDVGDRWKYDYDANLGGRGDTISLRSLNKYSDNIFDPELIDDSESLRSYYDEDSFLLVLKQQRDKYVYDLSSELTSLISEYGEDSSIVRNQRSLIVTEVANHNGKINRRKKQIEIALKGPQIYGGVTQPLFAPGEVPINDFSFLADYNVAVDIEKQKALTFQQAEVTGVVLPINPKFVKAPPRARSLGYEHLNIPSVGLGSIIYTPSSSPSGTVLSLTDEIVTENLIAVYNFLESKVVTPSSTDFTVVNSYENDNYNNAKLVAPNRNNVFFSGLGIPFLEGITKNKAGQTEAASSLGSFVRLPDTPEFRDLTYKEEGFTMECWTHVPNITDAEVGWLSATTSSLTKVLLGCENTGAVVNSEQLDFAGNLQSLDKLANRRGSDSTRGMLVGFTRDRRLTQESAAYSSDNDFNHPVSSLSLFVAPTIARDSSSIGFINSDDKNCHDSHVFHKMVVDLNTVNAIGNVSSQFVLVDVAVDPRNDEIRMYADGSLIATSSVSEVFGTEVNQPPNLPTFKKDNSFEYSSSSVDGPETLHQGPKLNPFFTPWIVGGGYTDGMYQHGNFMGGNHSGISSGLRGHIGSLKFYSKPLNNEEVKKNYDAQQGFFKNIK